MEIWYADLPLNTESSVQGGSRPVVILSNDIGNTFNPVVTVAPLTRQMKKLGLPTHVVIVEPDGLQSVFLAEQVMTIDKSQLSEKMGEVNAADRPWIEQAVKEQLGLSREENG